MTKNGSWKIKSSEEKYKNPWMEVREDRVIRPDGKDGIFGVVEMVPGVSILVLDNEGYVYLTSEFRYAIKEDSTEVVSGGIDKNEEPLEAAKRELAEELGIIAKDWIDLGTMNPFTSTIHSSAELYLARNLEFKNANPEGTENIKIIKIKLTEAVQMVMDSKITHGQSSVLILKAEKYLQLNEKS